MYAIHTTPGFIIEARPKGEADKLLYIFTRELGLIMASAQGIRLEKSKLRYHSQEFSLAEFSFVRGKEFWRLTNANQLSVVSSQSQVVSGQLSVKKTQSKVLEIIPRIALILRRFLHGEEAHRELFDNVQSTFLFVKEHQLSGSFSDNQIKTLESLVVFRILHFLGYIGDDKGIGSEIFKNPISLESLNKITGLRENMNRHINKALLASQL